MASADDHHSEASDAESGSFDSDATIPYDFIFERIESSPIPSPTGGQVGPCGSPDGAEREDPDSTIQWVRGELSAVLRNIRAQYQVMADCIVPKLEEDGVSGEARQKARDLKRKLQEVADLLEQLLRMMCKCTWWTLVVSQF